MKKLLLSCLTLITLSISHSSSAFFTSEPELLSAEDAFQILASFKDPKTLRVEYIIAEGYFMYRHRFQFNSQTPETQLGKPLIPTGVIKQDEYFGEVETYREQIVIEIPINSKSSQLKEIQIDAISQGCADAGVCYPIQTQTITIETQI